MIRIVSKKDGFRRCGVAHPEGPTDYPDDRFTEKEIEVLKNEPMLVVQELPDPEPKKETGPPEATEEEKLIEAAREVMTAGEVTNDGKPTVESMTAILGRPVTAQERDAAWEKIRAEGNE